MGFFRDDYFNGDRPFGWVVTIVGKNRGQKVGAGALF